MDRCACWKTTQVSVYIEHCPSAEKEIAKEIDRIIQYAMKGTDLSRLGKVHVSTIVLKVDEVNNVSSLSTKANS